ncbi:hypothetical protein [Streptomyces sp. NPDC059466]|uniref:dCTP deaminase domain-containing protein n=1 Tax=unclassified Streptomyces TaxID=2593676 RepID=UPI0036D19E70
MTALSRGLRNFGRLGLFVNITADLIDIGSHNNWTLRFHAVQPIRIYPGMRIGQAWPTSRTSPCSSCTPARRPRPCTGPTHRDRDTPQISHFQDSAPRTTTGQHRCAASVGQQPRVADHILGPVGTIKLYSGKYQGPWGRVRPKPSATSEASVSTGSIDHVRPDRAIRRPTPVRVYDVEDGRPTRAPVCAREGGRPEDAGDRPAPGTEQAAHSSAMGLLEPVLDAA